MVETVFDRQRGDDRPQTPPHAVALGRWADGTTDGVGDAQGHGRRIVEVRAPERGGPGSLTEATERPEGRATADPPGQADSRVRPLRRRARMMDRPARVRMRARKPCLRARRRVFGWNVRFTVSTSSDLELLGSSLSCGAHRVRAVQDGSSDSSPSRQPERTKARGTSLAATTAAAADRRPCAACYPRVSCTGDPTIDDHAAFRADSRAGDGRASGRRRRRLSPTCA